MTTPKEIKDQAEFLKMIGSTDLERPEIVLISGDDVEAVDSALDRMKHRVLSRHKDCLVPVFGNEPDDDNRFLTEIENVPLFSPFRLIVVRDAQAVFASILKQKDRKSDFAHFISSLPDRTWILVHYSGRATDDFLSLWGSHAIHLATKDLYPEQVIDYIRNASRRAGLSLAEEAVLEIRDRIVHRPGAIDAACARIRDHLPAGEKNATLDFVQEVLFPYPGWNLSTLVDSLFAGDSARFFSEIAKRDPSDDYYRPMKAVLNRTDELRRARIALDHGLSDKDVMMFTGHGNKHPYVQKKILQRLRYETERFSNERILSIYDALDSLFKSFRRGTDRDQQEILFTEKVASIFF